MPEHSRLPYVWMVCGACSFAAMSTQVTLLGPRLDWQTIAVVRAGLAMVFAAGLAVAGGAKLVYFRPATLWMRSLAGSGALISGFFSLTRMRTTEVLTLTNMFPIWVALLSWPLLGVRPRRDVWGAVVCGVVGVVLMQQPRLEEGNYLWLIALGSSLFSAVALIGLHKLQGIDPRAVVAHFSAVSLAFCVVAWLVFPRRGLPLVLQLEVAGLLLGVGVTATAGQILLTKAFAAGEPGKVSVVGLSQVGFGMVFELLLGGQAYNGTTLAGIALVLAPTAWLMLRRPLKRMATAPTDGT